MRENEEIWTCVRYTKIHASKGICNWRNSDSLASGKLSNVCEIGESVRYFSSVWIVFHIWAVCWSGCSCLACDIDRWSRTFYYSLYWLIRSTCHAWPIKIHRQRFGDSTALGYLKAIFYGVIRGSDKGNWIKNEALNEHFWYALGNIQPQKLTISS